MEDYKSKMRDFVARLWSNPNIQSVPIARKENQILSFVRENHTQLQAAFARPEFFKGLSWDDAIRLLLNELTETVVLAVQHKLEEILERVAHPAIKAYYADGQGGLEIEPDKFRDFILGSMRIKTVRDQYLSVLQTISGGFFDRYLPPILDRRKMIYMDVVRRDRVNLEPAYFPDYFKLVSLFRPLFYYKLSGGVADNLCLEQVRKDPRTYQKAMNELVFVIQNQVGVVPVGIYQPGLESCLPVTEHPEVSGASRLINIFVSRAQEYDPAQKQDRGAESPDKSWFNINRRTAKYSGYDMRFLEELYQIAGEEGW